MTIAKIKEKVKNLLQVDRLYFYLICYNHKFGLNYESNKSQLPIFKEIFYHKVYELGFPIGLENGVVLDIGAHYGYFALSVTRKVGHKTRIFSIEPDKSNYDNLVQNVIDSNVINIKPSNIAIGEKTTVRKIHNSASWNHSLFNNYLENMSGDSNDIQCLSLSDFMKQQNIDHIDFLKMDCEGSEHEIIQYTDALVLKKIKIISMEVHDMRHCGFDNDKTISILNDAGFNTIFSDYNLKKHRIGFNAKIVMQNAQVF